MEWIYNQFIEYIRGVISEIMREKSRVDKIQLISQIIGKSILFKRNILFVFVSQNNAILFFFFGKIIDDFIKIQQ